MADAATTGPRPYPQGRGARTTKRRGRLPPGARQALVELAPRWTVSAPLGWSQTVLDGEFGRSAPRLLDVGCGNGAATRAWAAGHPDHDVVAVDLHRPSLARLLRDLDADGPANIRAMELDATMLVDALEPATFTHVRILFPDPWPKRRHRGRRMVEHGFVARVADLLPDGGQLQVATDWADYADHIRSAIASEPRLRPLTDRSTAGWTSRRSDRPVTAYEQRALDAGRTVTDLVVRRVGSTPAAPRPSPST